VVNITSLGNIIQRIVGGGTPSRAVPHYWDGDIPWASVKDLRDGQLDLSDTEEHISEIGLYNSAANLIPEGTVVICTRMAVGKTVITTRSVAINQDLKAIFPVQSVDSRYLLFALDRLRAELEGVAVGSTVKGISLQQLKTLKLYIPPLSEQHTIADKLNTLDRQIQETSAIIDKLQQVKLGLLDNLLTRGLDENGDLRDPERNPEQFERSRLGFCPKAWEITSLGKVIEENGGFIQTGPFGSQLHSYEYQDEGIPVIMPQDLVDGFISEEQIARISLEKASKLSRHLTQENDVIFARRGDLSRCAPIESREVGWLCGTGSLLVRPPANAINGYWLAYTYCHDRSQRQILAAAVGSTMVNLNTSILTHLIVAKPPLHEQDEIVQRALQHDASIREEIEYQEKLQLLKQGLMDDLLTGRVRVTDIDISSEDEAQIFKYDIFISYASKDKELAQQIVAQLNALNYRVWFDQEQIKAGDSWWDAILDGINSSRCILPIVSKDYISERFVDQEIHMIEDKSDNRQILPVWHNVSYDDVATLSPSFASRTAISTNDEIGKIVEKISRKIGSE
jgi:type I restriction enzyme S subunit